MISLLGEHTSTTNISYVFIPLVNGNFNLELRQVVYINFKEDRYHIEHNDGNRTTDCK